ncbi:hypothetical protein BKP35_08980 [Anaerobacillus arseniciselenatis]|uniref:Uncharacterized protein n=1 Tax=Anaerobacillus arseniciselenatis TaxID=85682 RepID=A0A1S2LLF1_9BACI|nr:hypothetical protein [Anaerobacillus arseniciselenatis]OIJ13358.1 hypothetical protein BKP35_08980 [Anaerobacillus arseniciselenatis]
MKKVEFTAETLSEMTMNLLVKRLSEESPYLSNSEYGNGILEVIYNFNSVPKVTDRFSVIKQSDGEFAISFPRRKYEKNLLTKNIRTLYYVIQQYLSTRVVPQGKIIFEFNNGVIDGFQVINEGTYKDLARTGKSDLDLDEILFGEEDDEE